MQETEDVVLNEAAISDLKRGLEAVNLFELPDTMAFDEILMADLFFSEGRTNMKARPFNHFRCVHKELGIILPNSHAPLMNHV